MKTIRRLLGHTNSIILCFDHFDTKSIIEFEQKIDEISKYYQICSLSELFQNLKTRSLCGQAVICFLGPRQSALKLAIPFLIEKKLPFCLFLKTQELGSNQLTLFEEMTLYLKHYPQLTNHVPLSSLKTLSWERPDEGQHLLKEWKKTHGPLPIDQLDHLYFYPTWGKLLNLPQSLCNYGIHLDRIPDKQQAVSLKEQMNFALMQTKTEIEFFYTPFELTPESTSYFPIFMKGIIQPTLGEVKKDTSPHQLPTWQL